MTDDYKRERSLRFAEAIEHLWNTDPEVRARIEKALAHANAGDMVPIPIVVQMEPFAVRPDEAGRLLSVSSTVIYRLLARSEIRSIKLGHIRLVPVTELRAWLDRHLEEEYGQ